MCGRFAITLPHDAMATLFEALPANDLPEVPNYNVCPTDRIHAVTRGDDGRQLRSLRWGLLPVWYKTPSDGPLLINARSESVAEKPAFRTAIRDHRCLIPASGFYEWTKDPDGHRLPWYITRTDGAAMVFAGVWQRWARDGEVLDTCAILTTGANTTMGTIHHRVPVILEPCDWALWLGEEGKGAALLMRPPAEDALAFHRVDPKVNSNRAKGAELIEPVDA